MPTSLRPIATRKTMAPLIGMEIEHLCTFLILQGNRENLWISFLTNEPCSCSQLPQQTGRQRWQNGSRGRSASQQRVASTEVFYELRAHRLCNHGNAVCGVVIIIVNCVSKSESEKRLRSTLGTRPRYSGSGKREFL